MENITWLNQVEYPFSPHYLNVGAGRLHYVDEGQGEPIVLVHGTPVWSFIYRKFIKNLQTDYRCIAPDHLGLGLSDKPKDWLYTPAAHAENLIQLMSI